MASPPFFNLADTATWLAALTQITGVTNVLGAREASENIAGPRIDWVPTQIATAARKYTRTGSTQIAGNGAATFEVTLVAADFGELWKLWKAFYGAVDVCFGPPQGAVDAGGGYDIGKSSKPVRGGVVGAEWWAVTMPVTLNELAERAFNPPRVVTAMPMTVTTTAPDGSGSQQALP